MAASHPLSTVGWPIVGHTGRSIANVYWRPRSFYPGVSDADYAALESLVEAVRRDSDKGISGYTGARLADAQAAILQARPCDNERAK